MFSNDFPTRLGCIVVFQILPSLCSHCFSVCGNQLVNSILEALHIVTHAAIAEAVFFGNPTYVSIRVGGSKREGKLGIVKR